ncbi:hypothetical protein DL96DRAFT_1074510 [Flagelloscypha sp. PMI_526]|nr:hypothetical protein DL96DRAFT_1074510 [Flagelloscypha sp. PMI_526]
MTHEKGWAADAGMLDWDSTKIVFTKRTLLEFLKYTGTTVDPNFSTISKLPRYAQFGTITEGVTSADASSNIAETSATVTSAAPATGEEFKPTRRVRDPPGGKTHSLFGDDLEEDALSKAPPPAPGAQTVLPPSITPIPPKTKEEEEYGLDMPSSRSQEQVQKAKVPSKPTTTSFWDAEPEVFKPTRRVRENPGGANNIQFGV